MLRHSLPLLLICALTSCAMTSIASAQSQGPIGYYRGKLGNHLAVTMRLEENAGSYRYMLHGKPIRLTSVSSDPARICLDEQGDRDDYDKITGVFRGTIAADQSFVGKWTNADGTRSLDFNLLKFADVIAQRTECARYKAETVYPQFKGNSGFTKAINAKVDEITKTAYAAAVKDMDHTTSQPEPGPLPYEESDDTDVVFGDETFVSLLTQAYSYTGGAHGNTGYAAINLAWQHEQLIELKNEDIIEPHSRGKLDEVLIQALQGEKAAVAKDERQLKLEDLMINPTSTGLMFTFGPYEVDCYAAGTFTVMIPYKDLAGIVKTDGPLGKYLNPAATPSVSDVRD